jgi:hypothetical protein
MNRCNISLFDTTSSSITFIIGAALFVVQLAFDIMVSVRQEYRHLLPRTTVFYGSSSEGLKESLSWAPATMWVLSCSYVLYFPVDSIT